MRQVRLVLCTLMLGAVLGIAPIGSAQSLTFVKIDPTGFGDVWASGIATGGTTSTAPCSEADGEKQANAQGDQQEAECDDDNASPATSPGTTAQLVGYSIPQNTSYLWVANVFSPIGVPVTGAVGVFANGINGTGHVAGFYYDSLLKAHGFLQAGSTSFTTIDAPGAVWGTFATGINATDQVVGYYYDATFKAHGFLYAAGAFTTLDYPGASYTFATGISGLGQIVGYYYDASGQRQGWQRTGGSMSSFSVTGAIETMPHGINGSGEIVGEFRDANGHTHGFRLASGRLTVVDIPNATSSTYTAVNAISDSGEISGEYKDNLSAFVGGTGGRQLGFKMP